MSQTRMDLQFEGRMRTIPFPHYQSFQSRDDSFLNQSQAKLFRSENHPHLSTFKPLDILKRRISSQNPLFLYH